MTGQSLPNRTAWSVAISAPPSVSPVEGDGVIVFATREGSIAGRSVADGREAWSVRLQATQPLAADAGAVFVAEETGITALRVADGVTLWRASIGSPAAPPLAHEGWIVGSAGGDTLALRASDGTVVWRRAYGSQRERPAIDANTLFVPLEDGRIVAADLQTGDVLWQRRLGGAPAEPLAFAERVYVGGSDKFFYAIHAGNGRVMWRWRLGALVRGRPAADADRVYFTALDNLLRAVDRGSGVQRWHTPLPFRPDDGPVLAGGRVFVAGGTADVHAFDPVTGRPAGEVKVPAPLGTAPAYLLAEDGVRVAAITGMLGAEWRLTLLEPGPADLAVEPLTTLPGQTVPPPAR